jgi:hypothetical protein
MISHIAQHLKIALIVSIVLVLSGCSDNGGKKGGGSNVGGSGNSVTGALPSCRLSFDYGVAGGIINGTITNHESTTISRIQLSVTVQDYNRRLLGTRQLVLNGPFSSGKNRFQLSTGFAAGRYATISVSRCYR